MFWVCLSPSSPSLSLSCMLDVVLDVVHIFAEVRGLCLSCLSHSPSVAEAEKEVDTHAAENDEKRETFEDLPDHLTIGQEFTMRVTVLQAYGIASEYTDIFTQFK